MLTLFFVLFGMMCPAHAEIPLPPHEGAYSLGADFQYYKSTANYLSGGDSKSLSPGAYLTNMLVTPRLSYDWNRSWRSYASLSYSSTQTSNGTTDRSNSGFNEASLGTLMWMNVGRFSLIPQGDFTYPFWRVDEASDGALLGEGTMDLRGGVWGILRLHIIHPFVYAGFEYRDSGRASLVPYAAGVHLGMHQFWMQLAYEGFFSATDDSDVNGTDRTIHETYLGQVDGGSFRFDAVNPSVGNISAEAGVNLGANFKVFGKFVMSLNGASYADGWTGLVGLTFRGRHTTVADNTSPSSEDESEPEFKTEQDQYDQSLFIDNGVDQGERSKVHRRVRKTKSVDKLLNDTEKQLDDSPKN